MKCLFGWNTFSAVKTIYAYTPTTRFIVRQDVSVFFICISNLNAASHTCGESPITNKKSLSSLQKSFFPLLMPHDFFANQLFFKQCERHFMPDCNWCLWWCHPPPPSPPFTAKKLAQGHGPPSSEEKSHKQHALLLLLCIKSVAVDAFHLQAN